MRVRDPRLEASLRRLVDPLPRPDPDPALDPEHLAAVARRAGLEAVLATARDVRAAPGLRERWKRARRATQAGNLLREEAWEEVAETLRGAEIPFLPLKGMDLLRAGIASAGERPMRDIDLLVPEERAEEAAGLLSSSGWSLHARTEDQRVLRGERVHVEIHHRLHPRPLPFEPPEPGVWRRCSAAGGSERRLAPGDRITYLALHWYLGEVHRSRWISLARDLAACLDRGPEIAWEELALRSREEGARPFLARRLRELEALLGPAALPDAARNLARGGASPRRRLGFRLAEGEARRHLAADRDLRRQPGLAFYSLFWARWRDLPGVLAGAVKSEGGGLSGRTRRLLARFVFGR